MSRPATTLEFLRKIVVRDFQVDPHLLQPDVQLKDLAIDSLGLIEIMFAVEEEFSITVPPNPPDARSPINTIDDLVRYIDRLVSEQHGSNRAGEAAP